MSRALGVGQSLSSLSCATEQRLLAEKLEALQSRYGEVRDRCGRKAALLDQALANARLFGEEEVEVLNWLAEVEDKLGSVSIKDYKRDVLQKQHADQLVFSVFILFFFSFPSLCCLFCCILAGFVYVSGLALILRSSFRCWVSPRLGEECKEISCVINNNCGPPSKKMGFSRRGSFKQLV